MSQPFPETQDSPRVPHVEDLALPVSVVLAERRMPLERLMGLRPGALLDLGARHDTPLELRVSGSRVGAGRAIDIGERLAFRVEVVAQQLAALPGQSTG